jgi:hypothetical protein
MGASGASAGPGYPLQFLSPPAAGFRYFRSYPLRGSVFGAFFLEKPHIFKVDGILDKPTPKTGRF